LLRIAKLDPALNENEGTSPGRNRWRHAILAAKLALGVAIIAWLVETGQFDVNSYRELLTKHSLWLVLAVLAMQFLSFSVVLSRWWLLIHMQGINLTLPQVLVTGYQGLFANLVLPGSLGLDGIRLYHVRKHYRDRLTEGLASIVIDRVLGLVGMLVLTSIAGAIYWSITKAAWAGVMVAVTFGLVVTSLAMIAAVCGLLPWIGLRWLRRIRVLTRLLDAFALYKDHAGALILSLAISVLGHLFTCIAWGFGIMALGYAVPVIGVLAVTPLLLVLRSIPTTPLGLGVTDSAAEILYQLIGTPVGAELQMFIRVISVVIFLVCGVAFLGGQRPKRVAQ